MFIKIQNALYLIEVWISGILMFEVFVISLF